MNSLLVKKRSIASLRRKRSNLDPYTSATPSDQKPKEEKSAPYRNPQYRTQLEDMGSYMDKSDLDIADASKKLPMLARTGAERPELQHISQRELPCFYI